MYTVYCHIFPNGKKYIGITKNELRVRWENGNKYKSCILVDRAIKKYGWDNVSHEILAITETQKEAEEKERYFISLYKTTELEYGYNILPGGDVSDNSPSKEMREKLGRGWRGKHRSGEEKRKIGEGVRKAFDRPEGNGHIGLKLSENTKRKMSEAHKERWKDEERRIKQSDIQRALWADKDHRDKMMKVRKTQRHRKPGEYKMADQAKKKLSEQFKGRWLGENSPCSKPVLQYSKSGEFIKRWANAGEAERAGIAMRVNISKCCRGAPHVKSAGGYIWRFADE